jgi:agmatinase
MSRYGAQFGPDITFLGVDRCDLGEAGTFADADVVIVGAPFDGGTSYRSGARLGPSAMRQACYLGHDASRPSLAMRVDGLQDIRVVDAGDVEMYSGDAETSCASLERAIETVAASGAIPLVLGGDHTITWPDVTGVARARGWGKVSVIHFDAHADTGDISFGSLIGHGQPMRRLIESGAARGDRFLQIGLRGYWPPPDILDWMAEQGMRSYEMTEIVTRGLDECLTEAFAIATDECDGVFLSVDIDVCDPGHAPGTGTPEPFDVSATTSRWWGWTSSRSHLRTTTRTSPPCWATAWCSKRSRQSPDAARMNATARRGIRVHRCSPTGSRESSHASPCRGCRRSRNLGGVDRCATELLRQMGGVGLRPTSRGVGRCQAG